MKKVKHLKLLNKKDRNEKRNKEDNKLILSKKKITSHYIPPDITAIKILFEIFGKEVDTNSIESLSDQELLDMKDKLLEELKNNKGD